jgi:hypothetical protein
VFDPFKLIEAKLPDPDLVDRVPFVQEHCSDLVLG